jgi:hypothetical protein
LKGVGNLTLTEHLIVFKKNSVWTVPIKITQRKVFDLRAFEHMTWRDLIQGALEYLEGEAELSAIYSVIQESKKSKKNKDWKEKVRQTLQIHQNFSSIERGKWKLNIV